MSEALIRDARNGLGVKDEPVFVGIVVLAAVAVLTAVVVDAVVAVDATVVAALIFDALSESR